MTIEDQGQMALENGDTAVETRLPENFFIRSAEPGDVDTLAAVARTTWQHTYPGIISQSQIDYMLRDRYNRACLRRELAEKDIAWDLAMIGPAPGVAEGAEAVGIMSTHQLPRGSLKIDKLYVLPTWQRQGIGGALIALAEARALEHGCDEVLLAVNKFNARAITAYTKYGYKVRESVHVDIGEGFFMDDFIMAKSLLLDAAGESAAHIPDRSPSDPLSEDILL